jgi:6-pyruvoyltetrahydropterin/6-carboxytetrahydropterin synthase
MYTLTVSREFAASHYLIGGDWGEENREHVHQYTVELELEGASLDRHGYLVDIVDVETCLDTLVSRFSGQLLNRLPEFDGLNPSIEHFSRIFCRALAQEIAAAELTALRVTVWENDIARASFRQPF